MENWNLVSPQIVFSSCQTFLPCDEHILLLTLDFISFPECSEIKNRCVIEYEGIRTVAVDRQRLVHLLASLSIYISVKWSLSVLGGEAGQLATQSSRKGGGGGAAGKRLLEKTYFTV